MTYKIALAGNPNSGKTTLFNRLTGSNQYVGNWPGVTVEKKAGKLKDHTEFSIIDLPGIYSLSPYSLEEVIARNYLINDKPDAIINIIDGTNIERNLYLTLQLVELGIPVVLAINMYDLLTKENKHLDIDYLKERLGCEIVTISALKDQGIDELIKTVITLNRVEYSPNIDYFDPKIENILDRISNKLPLKTFAKRYFAIKQFEQDEKIIVDHPLDPKTLEMVKKLEEERDDDSSAIIANARYQFINKIVRLSSEDQQELTISDKIDQIVTNRWLALPIFAIIMTLVYYISVTTIGTIVTDWTNDVLFGDLILNGVKDFLVNINTSDWIVSLVSDGIIGGVGAVLGFVPQMLILFTFLALLEASGYMARIAFIMDRIFHRFGLSGKSFIPMLIGTGCSVPGIMASRTIENNNDRKMTIITTSFIPCSAKLPIIALIAGALFNEAWWVGPSAYFLGIFAVIISGIILKKTNLFTAEPSLFVMELPAYRVPQFKNIFNSVFERGSSFIKKAGTIIFISSIIIWFTSNVGIEGGKLVFVSDLNNGFLATFGKIIAPIFQPLGWGNWRSTVATITGLVAKENVVNTFGILYGVAEVSEAGEEIWSNLAISFTPFSAYSFLIFNLICAPCFAAIGAIKREMNNSKWTIFAIGYQTILAYVLAFIYYQIALFASGNQLNTLTILSFIFVGIILYLLFRKKK